MFCITSAVSVLGAYKPCPREARRFRLALFCSLLKVYEFWTCHVSILHQNATPRRSNTPATHEVDWMNGSRHNKNASRHSCLFQWEKYIQAPPSEASNIRCWFILKLRSSKNGIRTSPSFTAEDDKLPCCFWTEADKSILVNQHAVFRSGDKATFTLKRCASWGVSSKLKVTKSDRDG